MNEVLPPINERHRAKMEKLEQALLELPTVFEPEVKHYFAHGTYTREMFLPADTMLTGKIHRHSCINIVSKGRIAVVTDEGEYEIEAPHTFVSGPGVKKAGYTLEDTVWINVHPWFGEPDLEAIEAEMIIPSYEALEEEVKQCLGAS